MLEREFAKITTYPTLLLSGEEGPYTFDDLQKREKRKGAAASQAVNTGVAQLEQLVSAAAIEICYGRANHLGQQMTGIHCQSLYKRQQHLFNNQIRLFN